MPVRWKASVVVHVDTFFARERMSKPIPDKHIKRLVPTADKRRVRRDEKAALDPTNRGDQRKVRLKGGQEIPFSLAVQKATRWLRDREGHAEASVEELGRGMKDRDCNLASDLSHPVNSELLELLRASPRVEATELAGQKLKLRWRRHRARTPVMCR